MTAVQQTEQLPPDIIYIDDDIVCLAIFKMIAKKVVPDCHILTFNNPAKALAYIFETYSPLGTNNTLVFIDLNMSILDGWEVLEKIDQFPETLKNSLRIFIFSVSLSKDDVQTALDDPRICAFIEKPMTAEKMQDILLRYGQ